MKFEVLTSRQQATKAPISQGTQIGTRYNMDTGHDRVIHSDSSDSDDCGSIDTTLTVERDVIYAQTDFDVIDPSFWEASRDADSRMWRTDSDMYRTTSVQAEPDQTAECNARGDTLGSEFLQQQNMNMSYSSCNFDPEEVSQLSETRASVSNDCQNQDAVQDGSRINEITALEDNQSIESEWQSPSESGDEDADAYNAGVAEDFGQLPSKEIIRDPAVGRLYQYPWVNSGGDVLESEPVWYYVTRLPFGDYDEIGISGRLNGSPLCTQFKVPSCCRVPPDPRQPLTWAPGFEDGGPWVTRRKFPFLFLQKGLHIPPPGEDFFLPEDPPFTAWVDVKKLRSEEYQHPPEHDTRGLGEGIAIGNAFKLRLEAIRESMEAGLQFEFAPASPYPVSAPTVRTIEAELVNPQSRRSLRRHQR